MRLLHAELDRSSAFLSKVTVFLVQSTLFVVVYINVLVYIWAPDLKKCLDLDLHKKLTQTMEIKQVLYIMATEPCHFLSLYLI